MSTLLRVMSANNTAKGERGDQGGEVPVPAPAHPVPPPPALPGRPPHSPGGHLPESWALWGVWRGERWRCCHGTSEHLWPQQGGRHGTPFPAPAGLPLGSPGCCRSPEGTCGVRSEVAHVRRRWDRQGKGCREPSGTARRARSSSDPQCPLPGTGSSGGEASRAEIKRCFWEPA